MLHLSGCVFVAIRQSASVRQGDVGHEIYDRPVHPDSDEKKRAKRQDAVQVSAGPGVDDHRLQHPVSLSDDT